MNERQNAEVMYNRARGNLLLMIALTVVNIILVVIGSDSIMLFSATVPYSLVTIGIISESQALMAVCTVIALVGIGLYLLCWFLSKKHVAWMIISMILFILDSVALIGLCVLAQDFSSIMDIVIHAWVLYYLVMGVIYGYKLKKLPKEEPQFTGLEY